MSLAASTTVIARASAVDGRRPAPINATNDASTGRGDVSPSRLVLIFVRSYNRCMLHSTGSGALTHVNVYARVGHHAGSVDIVNRRALVTPSVSIKSDTCGADRRRDPTPKHSRGLRTKISLGFLQPFHDALECLIPGDSLEVVTASWTDSAQWIEEPVRIVDYLR